MTKEKIAKKKVLDAIVLEEVQQEVVNHIINKSCPEIKVILDRERTLRIDLNTMVRFETIVGKGKYDSSFEHVRAMLWAGLSSEDNPLTLEQIGSLIPLNSMTELANIFREAFDITDPLV